MNENINIRFLGSGTIIIPSFAVERTQTLMYLLDETIEIKETTPQSIKDHSD